MRSRTSRAQETHSAVSTPAAYPPCARGLPFVCSSATISRPRPPALSLPAGQLPPAAQGTRISYLYALAHLRAAREQLVQGLDTLLECEAVAHELGAANPAATLCWRSDAALLAARIGDQERARRLIAEELRLARAFGAPHTVGIALRAAGLIAGGDEGLAHLAEAVIVLDGSGSISSWPALSPSMEPPYVVPATGATPANRCGERLISRRNAARIAGADALTASERRVAQLAAQGLSNREIAQALFVSLPTVVTHLGHCYQKLNISSRRQLLSALNPAPADDG
jgi:DNA-binding CsgD family transcriptional regulator